MSNAMSGGGIDPSSALAAELDTLLGRKALQPSPEWSRNFLATQRPTTPASALASTATFRLLAGDITTSLNRTLTPALPQDIHDISIKERELTGGNVIVQILDVEDMGRSRWEQIEAIEAIERGEGTKGRQIIRVGVTEENGQQLIAPIDGTAALLAAANASKGPHKILLQDTTGATAYAIELSPIDGIDLNMPMGTKAVLRNCAVARGVILLEPSTVSLLGGKIEALHQAWAAGKKQRLLTAIEAHSPV